MTKMTVYATVDAVGGNIENVYGYRMRVNVIDSSNKDAVQAAKDGGWSNKPSDVAEKIDALKMQQDNNKMKGQLSSGADKKRIKELESEVELLSDKLAVYESTKDTNGNGKIDYEEMTNAELQKILDKRKVEYSKRDGKDALIKAAKDSE